jgi:hypothetical protein
MRPVIHVGFAHSGTTSLQETLFSRRRDIFYAGVPYSDLGGLFSWIKYLDPERYDHAAAERHCRELIFDRMRRNQRLVISDETLVEQPEIYYTPAMMPLGVIAERLRALFGECMILFTVRCQFRYVISMYKVLRRNYADLANREIESFEDWFAGNQTQVSNLYLRNLDYAPAIRIYQRVFGREAVRVLPLEIASFYGPRPYLARLGELLDLSISPQDLAGYGPRNVSTGRDVSLDSAQIRLIRERSVAGNAFLAETFDLPLQLFGYPMPAAPAQVRPDRTRAGLAEQSPEVFLSAAQ